MTDEEVWEYIERTDKWLAAELAGDRDAARAAFRLGAEWMRQQVIEGIGLIMWGPDRVDEDDEPVEIDPSWQFAEPVVIARGEVLDAWPRHKIRAAQFSYPGGKDGYWRSSCSCQSYLSGFFRQQRAAEAAGLSHAAAASQKIGEPS